MEIFISDTVKPYISYFGDIPLFRSLESQIIQGLPNDFCEWRRSYGRPTRNITFKIAATKVFDAKSLESYKIGQWSIIDQPVLHIFVTECSDVETYKSSVKEEIDQWIKQLSNLGIDDWMILLVETLDMKKTKNILPRTTVLDKIRLDFGAKQADRVISVLNPTKFESRATESFRSMLQRIRYLMLAGYNKNINKYEELIRNHRDKRNKDGWSFLKYFLLQEELAFVLEMLGLHTEALVQYDELDAMFSQFILNSVYGDNPGWMSVFEQPCNSFIGINLSKGQLNEIRQKIIDGSICLLDFRTYVLERQCTLLNSAEKPWETAERLMPFLYATEKELEILHIETADGSLACWEFICALEILNMCDQVQESKDIIKCSQYSAAIWNLAKDKLYELGEMCGLLPGHTPTSDQLHKVLLLSAGMEQDAEKPLQTDSDIKATASPARRIKQSAIERLREALGTNSAFQKLYLELSELSISTYKHVSRLRFARLVGLDLGDFYMSLDEPQKAVVFYTDLLRELKLENWNFLAGKVLLKLVNCYKKLDDQLNYAKTSAAISCSTELEILDRMSYFDEFLKLHQKGLLVANELKPDKDATQLLACSLEDHFKIHELNLETESPIVQDHNVQVLIHIESNFPREVFFEKVQVSLEMCEKNAAIEPDLPGIENARIPMRLVIDYKQDGTLNFASVGPELKGKQPARRKSSTRRKVSITTRTDFTNSLQAVNILLKPGMNTIEVSAKGTRVGCWILKQVSLQMQTLEFLSDTLPQNVYFEITTKPSSAVLSFKNLIAGLEQDVKLIVSGGSFHFPKDAAIVLKCSKNLRMRIKTEDVLKNFFERETIVKLHHFKPFEERTIELEAICDLTPGRRDDKQIEQKVSLQCPWTRNEITIPLHFQPALFASCRLHSSGNRKFLQVIIKSAYEGKLLLANAVMKCSANGVSITDINPKSQNELGITKNTSISYLWEIQVEPLKTEKEYPVIHVDFSIQYAESNNSNKKRNYFCTFDVMDYTTLFKIQAKIEPSELCRVGSVCHLQLTLSKVNDNPNANLMYEVLADQNFWAICDRSAGVITFAENQPSETIVLDVMPLSAGFLPLPNIRLSKYISAGQHNKGDSPRLLPFQPGQVYNSTKSLQIHVLASNNTE